MSPYFTYSTSITRESTSPSSSSGRRKMNEWRRKLCLLAPCESVASQASWKDLIGRLCDNILLWNNVWWLVIPVFRRVPLCLPLLTMRSVGAVVLALAAAALSSADSDTHRPRHDSNLEICILLLTACRAAAKCCPLMSVCKSLSVELKHLHGCVSLDVSYVPVESVCPPDLLLSDKRLFETKRKDQLNALKNLVELNDINQQYKIIDIMLKGLFKVQCVCVCVCIRHHIVRGKQQVKHRQGH